MLTLVVVSRGNTHVYMITRNEQLESVTIVFQATTAAKTNRFRQAAKGSTPVQPVALPALAIHVGFEHAPVVAVARELSRYLG